MLLKTVSILLLFSISQASNSTKSSSSTSLNTIHSSVGENWGKSKNFTLDSTNLTSTKSTEDLIKWLQTSFAKEVDDFKGVSGNLYNESLSYWDQVVENPCVQNGEVIIASIVGFVVGAIISPLLVFCCCKMRRRRYDLQNRRIRTVTSRERKVNITDLAHLMDRDQDSEVEVL
ncbi:unnamed protein product [Bursaphelenchus xylophilus]|uniref:(pine wood nematode) hypothetical protein n=1 Tax=Bursaphelenchus xylophilus TaxID=6326 RepID=A0A1I7RR50_BURXY|nr:unnamed protein product [Bursaphelenchus xylophilus]CAG9130841.1 unnamed protein product [Bursaphelenchus xylophilus]